MVRYQVQLFNRVEAMIKYGAVYKSIFHTIICLTYVRDCYYFYYKWTCFTFDVTNLKALCIRKLLM